MSNVSRSNACPPGRHDHPSAAQRQEAARADPLDAIDAVTHPDPWRWYEELATRPVHLDDRIGGWVVARPADVAEVLVSADVTVVPPGVPVPPHLDGTAAGALVAGMMRRCDGERHRSLRATIGPLFELVEPARLGEAIERATGLLDRSTAGFDDDALVVAWTDRFAPAVTAALLDAPEVLIEDLVASAVALARACAPDATPATTPAAMDAVSVVERWWRDWSATAVVAGISERWATTTHDAVSANVVGCLVQSVDACGGAIASTLERRLAGELDWPTAVRAALAETPPVHNTRRWTEVDLRLPSGTVPGGSAMLVLLAAGNDPGRGFGSGSHRCPAAGIVPTIVSAAASGVWDRLRDPDGLVVRGRRPSVNVRIADLGGRSR